MAWPRARGRSERTLQQAQWINGQAEQKRVTGGGGGGGGAGTKAGLTHHASDDVHLHQKYRNTANGRQLRPARHAVEQLARQHEQQRARTGTNCGNTIHRHTPEGSAGLQYRRTSKPTSGAAQHVRGACLCVCPCVYGCALHSVCVFRRSYTAKRPVTHTTHTRNTYPERLQTHAVAGEGGEHSTGQAGCDYDAARQAGGQDRAHTVHVTHCAVALSQGLGEGKRELGGGGTHKVGWWWWWWWWWGGGERQGRGHSTDSRPTGLCVLRHKRRKMNSPSDQESTAATPCFRSTRTCTRGLHAPMASWTARQWGRSEEGRLQAGGKHGAGGREGGGRGDGGWGNERMELVGWGGQTLQFGHTHPY
jgi:hypothetical protein